jgi:FtsH-binding integral membrane protein
MKNQEIWNFSQRFSSFAMMKSSVVLILLSLTNFFFQLDEKFQLIIGLGLIILATMFVFVSTEKAIKKNFTNS